MARQTTRRKINFINKCYKYILFLANFIFWIAGLGLLAVGILTYIWSGGIPKGSGNSPLLWLFNLNIVCMVVGCITVIVSFAGCIGSLRENICLLKFYSGVLFIMFLCECVLVILAFVYQDKATKTMASLLQQAFVKQYWEQGFEDSTNLVDGLQKELQCCGPESYKDWNINRYFSCQANNTSPQACGVPFSCCKVMNNIDKAVINTACGQGAQKLSNPEASKVVWTKGCVKAIVQFVEQNMTPVIGSIIGVAVLQMIAIFLAKVLHGQIREQVKLVEATTRST